jgi:two-component system, OmpR family, phosphate regulon sensor histidine kinase PhoR
MNSRIKPLIFISIIAILGILAMQFYWLMQYYQLQKREVEKQVTLSFEDAMKKEFSIRCDSVVALITEKLLDTTAFGIESKFDTAYKRHRYFISNARDKKNILSFTTFEFSKPLVKNDTALKRMIAKEYAERIRKEDLENHVVLYRLKNLGAYLDTTVKEFALDTARLRPILTGYLNKRNILIPFQFYLSYKDSTTNFSNFPDSLKNRFPIITKSFPTYKWWVKDEQFIRGLFAEPAPYIIARLKWMIVTSIALVLLAGCCVYFLFKAWMKEKRLSVIKDDFINNITHELKTPVATIAAAVEALSDFNVLEDPDKTKRYLKHSVNEVKKLNELVNKVLNVSLYENQQLHLVYESIPVGEALKEIMDTFLLIERQKKIDFTLHNCTPVDIINADKTYFNEAINNVIQNAIKYADDVVAITISCKKINNTFEIAIADNGWGIAAKDLPFIFDKFYRGIRKNHLVKGHGLGLYHVKHIMEMHKGSIDIAGKKEKGTIVYLRWPV